MKPSWNAASRKIGSVTDNPEEGRPGCPLRSKAVPLSPRGFELIRLQRPLDESYQSADQQQLATRIGNSLEVLGSSVVILGHHYQRDEVIRWAHATGDSFGLSRFAAENSLARFVVFCGVHFMAESADILTGDDQKVILPDLNAGCSMADMADLQDVQACWEDLDQITDIRGVIPITYMNSSAALKAFVGRNGGLVCTSSNARAALSWAFGQVKTISERPKVLFFPDQHLGRNTGVQLGYNPKDMHVWDPKLDTGGLEERQIKDASILLWKGHCSVHQRFSVPQIQDYRSRHPEGKVVVHPECSLEVVEHADEVGSTDFIIRYVASQPAGTKLAIGTEIHLVNRLANNNPHLTIESLDPLVCPCSTMFRIDPMHLCWVLENLQQERVVNQITVDPETKQWARVALERMLATTN